MQFFLFFNSDTFVLLCTNISILAVVTHKEIYRSIMYENYSYLLNCTSASLTKGWSSRLLASSISC